MERKLSKGKTIMIDGKEYRLRLGLAEAWDFEEQTGKHFLEVVSPIIDIIMRLKAAAGEPDANMEELGLEAIKQIVEANVLTAKDLSALFWAALGGKDSGLSVREAAALVDIQNGATILNTLFGAVIQSTLIPSDEESGSDEEPEDKESESESSEVDGDSKNATSSTGT